jgi:hypothetical protein
MKDRIPYTYRVTHITSGKQYYGCRFAKGCHPDDLGKEYFTSSKVIKDIIDKEGKDVLIFEVRKTFDCVVKCQKYENEVLKRLKVTQNEKWLNRYYGHIYKTEDQSLGGLNLKERRKSDKLFDENVRNNISKSIKIANEEGKCGFSLGHANIAGSIGGKSKSAEKLKSCEANVKKAQQSIMGSVWIFNPTISKRKRIRKEDLEQYLQIGWIDKMGSTKNQ